MKKKHILLSWIGHDSDFLRPDEKGNLMPNIDGPNITMHCYFEREVKYERHIILHTMDNKSQQRKQALESYFDEENARFPVEFKAISMPDQEVVNLQTLQSKMIVLLMGLQEDMVDILVTTGTKTMHTAWHLIHLHYPERTRLLQIRPKQFTTGGQPELLKIQFDAFDLPQTAIASELSLSRPTTLGGQVIAEALQPSYALATKIALTDKVPALILGESGAGKELLALHILQNSHRHDRPFRAINCAALADELLRSDLFGHVKGAFTGAMQQKLGYFEQCNGGTLFLDEIGDISPVMQQSLLRVLQEGEITPLGATTPIKVDVRIIAATHRNLPEACRAGKFRWDLYYRLAVVELNLPSLAEWSRIDRIKLWDHLVYKKQKEFGKSAPLQLSKEVQDRILQYPFPGNVREMENLVSRLYVIAEGKAIHDHLPGALRDLAIAHPMRLEEMEKLHIQKVLEFQGHNLTASAKVLDIAVNTLKNKCDKYGIPLKVETHG